MNMNTWFGTGNLTKDPELRETRNGKSVCTLRLAINRRDEGADYINISVWNGAAEACAKYLSKGSPVAVTGSIRTGTFDKQDGSKGYSFEITAQRVEFLNRRNGDSQQPEAVEPSSDTPPHGDDDIPF